MLVLACLLCVGVGVGVFKYWSCVCTQILPSVCVCGLYLNIGRVCVLKYCLVCVCVGVFKYCRCVCVCEHTNLAM